MVDVILCRRQDFGVFDTYISEYDRSMALLEESCRTNPAFAGIVKKFEVKHWIYTEKSSDHSVSSDHSKAQLRVELVDAGGFYPLEFVNCRFTHPGKICQASTYVLFQ